MPTNSLSVKLQVFSFCLPKLTMGNPVPSVIPPPVCPRIFGCTANDASTYHSNLPLESAPSVSGIESVALRYSTKCHNFFQSSMVGSLTLVVRNEIDVEVSGLACFVTKNVFATIWYSYFGIFLIFWWANSYRIFCKFIFQIDYRSIVYIKC